jgi:hypothetical protein
VCESTGLTLAHLHGRSRAADEPDARRVTAEIAADYLRHAVADLTQLLRKNPGSVSRWLYKPRAAQTQPEMVSKILTPVNDLNSSNGTS